MNEVPSDSYKTSNRILTATELETLFEPLVASVRAKMRELTVGDEALYWALRRKLYKELSYDERGTPMHRRALKRKKYAAQAGRCAACGEPLPVIDAVLDRLEAMAGYVEANTRVLCRSCDLCIQQQRRFS